MGGCNPLLGWHCSLFLALWLGRVQPTLYSHSRSLSRGEWINQVQKPLYSIWMFPCRQDIGKSGGCLWEDGESPEERTVNQSESGKCMTHPLVGSKVPPNHLNQLPEPRKELIVKNALYWKVRTLVNQGQRYLDLTGSSSPWFQASGLSQPHWYQKLNLGPCFHKVCALPLSYRTSTKPNLPLWLLPSAIYKPGLLFCSPFSYLWGVLIHKPAVTVSAFV